MLVLIDENGDPGFKLTRGSSTHFLVAMVIFEDFREAERASAAIGELRERLGIKPEFEFSGCRPEVRDRFFETVAPYQFQVRALVVDKAKIYSPHLRETTDSFYNFFLRQLIEYDDGILAGASIKIDGKGSRKFKKQMAAYLRRHLPDAKVNKIRIVDSKGDNLVQLADMVAGAIGRSYMGDRRKTPWRWRHALVRARKINNIWEFQ